MKGLVIALWSGPCSGSWMLTLIFPTAARAIFKLIYSSNLKKLSSRWSHGSDDENVMFCVGFAVPSHDKITYPAAVWYSVSRCGSLAPVRPWLVRWPLCLATCDTQSRSHFIYLWHCKAKSALDGKLTFGLLGKNTYEHLSFPQLWVLQTLRSPVTVADVHSENSKSFSCSSVTSKQLNPLKLQWKR